MSRLVLTNVNLLDGTGPAVSDRTIVIDGERIASVAAEAPVSRPEDRVGRPRRTNGHARHGDLPLPLDLPQRRYVGRTAASTRRGTRPSSPTRT